MGCADEADVRAVCRELERHLHRRGAARGLVDCAEADSARVRLDLFREIGIGRVEALVRAELLCKLESLVEDVDDDDLKDGIKDGFGYIYTVYDIGAEDIAIDMLKDVADALHIAQSKPYFGTNTGYLEELENELRECLGSDNPFDWFEYTGETGSDPASAGALNMYRSLEHMIPKDLRNEFLALASDPKRVTEFQGFLRDRVLDNLDTYLETVLSYNTAIETCIGDLMDSEFDDEDDAYAYILDDASLTAPYLLEEFTNAFSFLIFIDDIGMHDDAMAILKDVLDAAENLADDDDERTVPCLRDLCNSIGASIDDDDVTGWMDEDMLQLHTLLFSY